MRANVSFLLPSVIKIVIKHIYGPSQLPEGFQKQCSLLPGTKKCCSAPEGHGLRQPGRVGAVAAFKHPAPIRSAHQSRCTTHATATLPLTARVCTYSHLHLLTLNYCPDSYNSIQTQTTQITPPAMLRCRCGNPSRQLNTTQLLTHSLPPGGRESKG